MALTAHVVGLDEVRDLLQTLPEHLFDAAKREISRSLFEIQSNITEPMEHGQYDLQSRTGSLARSIKFNTSGANLSSLSGALFTNSVYAPIQENGGTITAKNAYMGLAGGPFLNIPADANRTLSGIMRKTARTVFNEGGYVVAIDAPSAKYMVVLDGEPMFWLVKSVEITGNLRMVKNAEDEVPTLLSNLNNNLFEGIQ